MDEENKDQKTEEASPKRILETQEKGNFAHSRELTSAFVLLMAIISFSIAGAFSTKHMMGTWNFLFNQSHVIPFQVNDMRELLGWVMKHIFIILSPVLFSIMLGGILANLIQTGGLKISLHPLIPKFHKLNPLTGFKRIFSWNSMMELFKSIFKITIISLIAYFTIQSHLNELPAMMDMDVGPTLVIMGEMSLEIMIWVLLAMMFLAVLDYAFQRFTYLKNLRMTKQQVKEERKDTEGNPLIKQRVRSVQLDMMRRRMMAAVPDADVVVTNPTEIAVAIRYNRENSEAPVVVAKGRGVIAAKIREVALANDVPIVENKPLAQLLHKSVEISQLIPAHLYQAVAEILAYVYRLKGKNLV